MGKEQELRPCPFCGGAMQHRFALWPSEGDRDAIIHAAPTDCPIEGAFSIDTFDDGVSVAEAWNRRSSSDEAEVVAEPFLTGRGWENLSCDDQFALATQIAANIGYDLVAEPEHPDSPHNRAHSVSASPSGVKAGVTEEVVREALRFISDIDNAHPVVRKLRALLPTPIQGDAK